MYWLFTGAAFLRLRFEVQFEQMNQAVFAESSKFAAESIGAFRTVTSLTLENTICRRYEVLLADHVQKAFNKSRYSALVFSASDSIGLLCMALTFWYGGRFVLSCSELWNLTLTFPVFKAAGFSRIQCPPIFHRIYCGNERCWKCWCFHKFWS